MKVAVFGGSGFIGSHVAEALTEAGHKVTIYDINVSEYLSKGQTMVAGDIMDEKLVDKTVKGADIVYNFAGIADLDQASAKPLETVRCNILGNSIILEACRRHKVKRFVFASSLYVYSKAGSFYRSTKQACELIIENYHEVFGLEYTILRYGSLYGPRADKNNFIHKILRQAIRDKKIVRQGDGEEIREYIHAHDAARCSVEILSKEFANQHVIITGSQQMKVRDLLLMVKEMLGNKIDIEYVAPRFSHHYEITPYSFSPKMAKKMTSRTYLDLSQGILDCMQRIYKEENPLPAYDGLIVRGNKKSKAKAKR